MPPSVHVVLAPSRIAGVGIGLLAAGTLMLVLGYLGSKFVYEVLLGR